MQFVTGKAPVIAVYIRNFLKKNILMTVMNIIIIADPPNIFKRKFKKTIAYCQKFVNSRNKCKMSFSCGNKNRPFILKAVLCFF